MSISQKHDTASLVLFGSNEHSPSLSGLGSMGMEPPFIYLHAAS